MTTNNDPSTIFTSHLPNGVRIVSHTSEHHHSCGVGIFWLNGAPHQTDRQAGYDHFLEHLLFKGTAEFDAKTLSLKFEAMGGHVNGHTGREISTLYGVVPSSDYLKLARLLASMVAYPCFGSEDVSLERDVVLQEMAMTQDVMEEALRDKAIAAVWRDHPMGKPVLGNVETIDHATAASLRFYWRQICYGRRFIVVATGNIHHDSLVHACQDLSTLPAGEEPQSARLDFIQTRQRQIKPLSQNLMLWLMPAPGGASPMLHTLHIANHILGGGTSSRLFKQIRERLGLAYHVSSRIDIYQDSSLWMIECGCDPKRQNQCQNAIAETLEDLARHGPTETEMALARQHLSATLMIDADNPEAIMERMARENFHLGRGLSLDQHLAHLDAATAWDVKNLVAAAAKTPSTLEWTPLEASKDKSPAA